MLKEAIDGLNVIKGGLYIDATYGEGGHASEIEIRGGKVLGIDWSDDKNYQEVKKNSLVISDNFANIEKIAKDNQFYPCDGILFDFGLSMNQIRNSKRGFSYKEINDPLDMRINKSIKNTASDLINNLSDIELYEIFSKNSEEINSWSISKHIARNARLKRIETVGDLVEILKGIKGSSEHTIKRIFQALRMEVNSELSNIEMAFKGALKIVKRYGRLVFITFHSVEDRVVKQLIREERDIKEIKKVRSRTNYTFEKTALLRIVCV